MEQRPKLSKGSQNFRFGLFSVFLGVLEGASEVAGGGEPAAPGDFGEGEMGVFH